MDPELVKKIKTDDTLTSQEKSRRLLALLNRRLDTPFSTAPVKQECTHYPNRGCLLYCDECGEYWTCRFCHNDTVLSHEFDRQNVKSFKCRECYNITNCLSFNCEKCEHHFGKYICKQCNVVCDDSQVFHCNGCGICRKGTLETVRHCEKCDMCYSNSNFDTHPCKLTLKNQECPVCQEPVFDSIKEVIPLPKCGHTVHSECYRPMLRVDYRCPLCKKSACDMNVVFDRIRETYAEALAQNTLSKRVEILCNDCEFTFDRFLNLFGLHECPECKGFNCCVMR